jgi:hypothetical protein
VCVDLSFDNETSATLHTGSFLFLIFLFSPIFIFILSLLSSSSFLFSSFSSHFTFFIRLRFCSLPVSSSPLTSFCFSSFPIPFSSFSNFNLIFFHFHFSSNSRKRKKVNCQTVISRLWRTKKFRKSCTSVRYFFYFGFCFWHCTAQSGM